MSQDSKPPRSSEKDACPPWASELISQLKDIEIRLGNIPKNLSWKSEHLKDISRRGFSSDDLVADEEQTERLYKKIVKSLSQDGYSSEDISNFINNRIGYKGGPAYTSPQEVELECPSPSTSTSKAPRIAIIDSGVGGLSILKAVREKCPEALFYYGLDDDFYPYGTKDERTVANRVLQFAKILHEKFIFNLIVLACNTASTVSLDLLRKEILIPIVGVVPAIKPAAALSQTRTIGLLATETTVETPYVDRLIAEHAPGYQVVRKGSRRLVDLAEKKLRGEPISLLEIREEIEVFLEHELVDVVVLGCTHFSHLKEEFEQTSLQKSKKNLQWIDTCSPVAERVHSLLRESGFRPEGKRHSLPAGKTYLVRTRTKLENDQNPPWEEQYGIEELEVLPLS